MPLNERNTSMNRINRIITILAVPVTLVLALVFMPPRNFALIRSVPDGWDTALGSTVTKRREQVQLIQEQQGKIIEAARPLVEEQEKIEKEEEPFLKRKRIVLNRKGKTTILPLPATHLGALAAGHSNCRRNRQGTTTATARSKHWTQERTH